MHWARVAPPIASIGLRRRERQRYFSGRAVPLDRSRKFGAGGSAAVNTWDGIGTKERPSPFPPSMARIGTDPKQQFVLLVKVSPGKSYGSNLPEVRVSGNCCSRGIRSEPASPLLDQGRLALPTETDPPRSQQNDTQIRGAAIWTETLTLLLEEPSFTKGHAVPAIGLTKLAAANFFMLNRHATTPELQVLARCGRRVCQHLARLVGAHSTCLWRTWSKCRLHFNVPDPKRSSRSRLLGMVTESCHFRYGFLAITV